MDPKHRKLILENTSELIEKTENIDEVVRILEDRKILNVYMIKHLQKFPEQKKRKAAFFEMILGRGPNAFQILQQALRATNNYESEKILNSLKVSYFVPIYPVETELSRLAINKDVISINDHNVVVKIHPEKKFMDVQDENAYKMRSKPRGMALIINIFRTIGRKDRLGSKKDARKVESLFTQLGYEVTFEPNKDLQLKEFKEKILLFSKKKQLSVVNSLVVFIMCHGKRRNNEDFLLSADGEDVSVSWILEQFNSTLSPFISSTGERKPKLFFFQACRENCEVSTAGKVKSDTYKRLDVNDNVNSSTSAAFPEVEDYFIVHSTLPGSPSMRDPTKGTWFVNEFCDVVAENAWSTDLESMIEMVNERIRGKNPEEFGSQTVDVLKPVNSKKIFFNPGLF